MRVLLKERLIVLIPESAEEVDQATLWRSAHGAHVFQIRDMTGAAMELHDLGERVEACREPLNIVSTSLDPLARLIGNFATTPFQLDGAWYQSVESFWQGLKFPAARDRRRLSGLEGPRARAEGERQGYGATISHGGREIVVGTWPHWMLMAEACRAKFGQNAEARAALLATGERPLTHRVRRDSRTIPGVIMADIWMRIRKEMRLAG